MKPRRVGFTGSKQGRVEIRQLRSPLRVRVPKQYVLGPKVCPIQILLLAKVYNRSPAVGNPTASILQSNV